MMKKGCVFWIVILCFVKSYSKENDKSSFSIGVCNTDFYTKYYIWKVCDEGCYPTSQKAHLFFDFNYLFHKSIGADCFIDLGGGINQKGFQESGMISDGTTHFVPYETLFIKTYVSAYSGISIDIFHFDKLTINIAQLLIPELGYKSVAFSTRTSLSIERTVSNKMCVHITPFFHTALNNYEETTLYGNTTSWKPFGFGIGLGLYWLKKEKEN
jgi:hypothetical protein